MPRLKPSPTCGEMLLKVFEMNVAEQERGVAATMCSPQDKRLVQVLFAQLVISGGG